MSLPKMIEDKLSELDRLCEANPNYIPLPEAAKFLGVNPDGLRYGIEQGTIDFGLCWSKPRVYRKGKRQIKVETGEKGNRAFKIPTVTFYIWVTRGETLRAGYEYKGAKVVDDVS